MPMLKNPRHEAFAQGIAKGMSASEAYEAAGYKPHRGNAARMSANESVRERVLELIRPAIEETEVTVTRVVEEMAYLAFQNPVDAIRAFDGTEGKLEDISKLPEGLQHAIVGISPVKVAGQVYYRLKFADKLRALDSLARHLQMFKGIVEVENVFKVIQEMSDEELDRRLAELHYVLKVDKDPV